MSAPVLKTAEGKAAWSANASIFDSSLRTVGEQLLTLDQAHLFSAWPAPGQDDEKKKRFLQQVRDIESAYIGGITTYVSRAQSLLKLAAIGANPYEGFVVSEPKDAVRITAEQDFAKYEKLGLEQMKQTAFVIVAGGLGERLGYRGIKLALPSDITTETTYIELYVQWILALQARVRQSSGEKNLELQFAIMTSDDTDQMTRELLTKNHNFGMTQSQLTIFKQGKVPSLLDNAAHFVLDEKDPYVLDTKPHGHGDVHSLLYKEGIVERWVKGQAGNGAASSSSSSSSSVVAPVKWVVFFQDTNGLVFHSIVAAVGVSSERKLHMNSITVPRAQGDAVGAICTLTREKPLSEGELKASQDVLPNQLTINVEYNQLEGLLGKGVKEPLIQGTNYSIYPGNINVLILNAPDYLDVLKEKKGAISEFCNPKYASAEKHTFKKPTRLECMMQDYPKLLPAGVPVSFTQFERDQAFSAVKNAIVDGVDKIKSGNAPEVAASGEQDMYAWPSKLLQSVGAKIESAQQTYRGISVSFTPHIVLTPAFGVTQEEIRSKVKSAGSKISVTSKSTLVLDGEQISVTGELQVDGALIVQAHPFAKVRIEGLHIKNAGWSFKEIAADKEAGIDQKYLIRGYTLDRQEQVFVCFEKEGEYVLNDQTVKEFQKEYKNHPARRAVA